MARENNAMSAEEIREFLSSVQWVALGVLDASGAPVADLAPACVVDERLFFTIATGAATRINLDRDSRCCCSIDIFPSYYEIKGVTVHGRAMRVEPSAAVSLALHERARALELPNGVVYAMPLLDDAFGFDFGKIARR